MKKTDSYIVSLDSFTGPLDLLHQLIERRKLQINTISLAKVTSDYLAHIRATEQVSPEEMSNFVYLASLLVLIKSKSLLPILEYTKEEEVSVAELEGRMHLFRFVKQEALPAFYSITSQSVPVTVFYKRSEVVFLPDNSCTVHYLHRSALSALQEVSFLKDPPKKKVQPTLSLEVVIERVLTAVTDRVTLSFRSITKSKDRPETVVSFLAVLELIRNDVLSAQQDTLFDDILVARRSES